MEPISKPNVVLITFDDCRADHMGYLGYKKNITPFLDSIAKEGVYFTNAFATGSGSPQSFVGAFTSTYPADYGGFAKIEPPRKVMSEVFKEHGYETIAVHSATYLSDYFGYNRGWDRFDYATHAASGDIAEGHRQGTAKSKILRRMSVVHARLVKVAPFLGSLFDFLSRIILYIRKLLKEISNPHAPFYTGEEITEEVKKVLSERKDGGRPLFLWVHYMDVHEPLGYFMTQGRGLKKKIKYHLGDAALFLFGGNPKTSRLFKKLYLNLYDESIRYVDANAGNLVAFLKEQGIVSHKDFMAFSADHGEEFFEKGIFGHDQRPYRANLNIPLILWSPRRLLAHAEERPVSLLDLSPTLFDFAGLPKPDVYKGTSLLDVSPRPVISQAIDCEGDLSNEQFIGATITDGSYRFIDYRHEKKLYALEDTVEEHNLIDSESERNIAEALQKKLAPYIPATYEA